VGCVGGGGVGCREEVEPRIRHAMNAQPVAVVEYGYARRGKREAEMARENSMCGRRKMAYQVEKVGGSLRERQQAVSAYMPTIRTVEYAFRRNIPGRPAVIVGSPNPSRRWYAPNVMRGGGSAAERK